MPTWWAASESEEESSRGEENMARDEEVIELSGEVAIEAIEVAAPAAVGGIWEADEGKEARSSWRSEDAGRFSILPGSSGWEGGTLSFGEEQDVYCVLQQISHQVVVAGGRREYVARS